jgi:hypothetical protein
MYVAAIAAMCQPIFSPFAYCSLTSSFGGKTTILLRVSFVVAWPLTLYCCIIRWFIVEFAATVTP